MAPLRYRPPHDFGLGGVAIGDEFQFATDIASALIVGTASPAHILADHAALRSKIPPAFWEDLRSTGILHPDAAVPANKD